MQFITFISATFCLEHISWWKKPRIEDELAGANGTNFIPRAAAVLHHRTNAKSILDIALQRSYSSAKLAAVYLQQIHPHSLLKKIPG